MYDVLRMGMWTEVSKPRRGAFLAQSEKFAKSYPLRSGNRIAKIAPGLPFSRCAELTR